MVTKKRFHTIRELQEIQRIASHCSGEVGLHSEDDTIIIDAKSYIGLYTLDFSKPVLVVSEVPEFHRSIMSIGENL